MTLFCETGARDKRARLRSLLTQDGIIRAPGAFSPLVAMQIEKAGFDAVYVSGAVLSADLGLPDIGLTTLSEVADRAEQIARVTELPTIVDCDTGFGEPMSVARSVRTMQERGIAGLHLEDQVNPKRCGHLEGKSVVPVEQMLQRIKSGADVVFANRDESGHRLARGYCRHRYPARHRRSDADAARTLRSDRVRTLRGVRPGSVQLQGLKVSGR